MAQRQLADLKAGGGGGRRAWRRSGWQAQDKEQ